VHLNPTKLPVNEYIFPSLLIDKHNKLATNPTKVTPELPETAPLPL